MLPKTLEAPVWLMPMMVNIAITIPTMNISGVKPMNDGKNMIAVAVKLPQVPAYPGSAHNLFPMNTSRFGP